MNITEITPVKPESNEPIRLAAYCRVSSDSEDQLHSFAAQISADTADSTYYEQRMGELSIGKQALEAELKEYADTQERRDAAKSRLDEITAVIDALANHQMSFDDRLVRQVLECVIVESKEEIKVVFRGGHEVICTLYR